MNISSLLIKRGDDLLLTKVDGTCISHHWSLLEFPSNEFLDEAAKLGLNPIWQYSRPYSIPVNKQSGTRNVYVADMTLPISINRGIAFFTRGELEEFKGNVINPFKPLLDGETYADLRRLGYI